MLNAMSILSAPDPACETPATVSIRRAEAIAWLYGRINYEQTPPTRRGTHALRLQRMQELCERLGRPALARPTIHIAGTKGKGSTAAMIASILHAAGYRTGLFTSPHLEQIEERFCVDGSPALASEFVELAEMVRTVVDEMDVLRRGNGIGPTFFEICTAIALLHFERCKVDAMVLEVGLGGRLDSTNICRPRVCAITSISYDHTRQLGDTLTEIAREKAGIIKPGVPVVSGVTSDEPRRVIERIAAERGSRLVQLGRDFSYDYHASRCDEADAAVLDSWDYLEVDGQIAADWPNAVGRGMGGWGRSEAEPPADLPGGSLVGSTPATRGPGALVHLPLPLLGEHQAANAAVSVATSGELVRQGWKIPPESVRQGLARAHLPARAQLVHQQPAVLLDTAHNVASIVALARVIETHFPARRRHLIFAATQDKDVRGMLEVILPLFDTVRLTRYSTNPRGLPLAELADLVDQILPTLDARPTLITHHDSAEHAWLTARAAAAPNDLLCITGSFFLAAELRRLV
jgi:dihydrofolate synthase/folylpolyglutamate synthase